MLVRLSSYLSCLVSLSSPVTYILYSHTSYIHTFIQSDIHIIIHSYINTFPYSYIHAYTTYTQHHSYMVASVTQSLIWLYHFGLVLNQSFQVASSNQRTTCIYLSFSQSVIPCFVKRRDVTQSLSSQSVVPCFVRKRDVTQSLYSQKCRPLLCQKTRCHSIFIFLSVSIPRIVG
jgi:hypothetical protein